MQPLQAFTKATAACGWQQAAPPNVRLQGAQPKVAWGHRGIHCRVGAPTVTQRRSAARPWKGCRSIGALMLRAQPSGAQQVLTELGLSQASAQTWLLPPTTCHPLPPRTRPGGTGVRGRAQGRFVCACAGPHGTAPWQALRPLQGVAARPGGRGSRWWHLYCQLLAVPKWQSVANHLNAPRIVDGDLQAHVCQADILRHTGSGFTAHTCQRAFQRDRP